MCLVRERRLNSLNTIVGRIGGGRLKVILTELDKCVIVSRAILFSKLEYSLMSNEITREMKSLRRTSRLMNNNSICFIVIIILVTTRTFSSHERFNGFRLLLYVFSPFLSPPFHFRELLYIFTVFSDLECVDNTKGSDEFVIAGSKM